MADLGEDLEGMLLGALLLRPEEIKSCIDRHGVRAAHFEHPTRMAIYDAMVDLDNHNRPIGLLAIRDHMQSQGHEEAKKVAWIGAGLELIANESAGYDIPDLCQRLITEARRRELMETMFDAQRKLASGRHPDDVAVEVAGRLDGKVAAPSELKSMPELMREFTAVLEHGLSPALSWGFPALDAKYSGGMRGGEFHVLAARPGMGKSAMAAGVALHAALRQRVPAAMLCLEMTALAVVTRMVAAAGQIDLGAIKRREIKTQDEWDRLAYAMSSLADAPLHLVQCPGLSVPELRSHVRRLVRSEGCGLIVLDYLQLMSGPTQYANKAVEVAEISKACKHLALEFDVPFIGLSQLNRSVESRSDKRPMMSDLRESGAIEQDADSILFLYREEYYLREKTPEAAKGIAECIVAKQRDGETGMVPLRWHGPHQTFTEARDDWSPDDYAP